MGKWRIHIHSPILVMVSNAKCRNKCQVLKTQKSTAREAVMYPCQELVDVRSIPSSGKFPHFKNHGRAS